MRAVMVHAADVVDEPRAADVVSELPRMFDQEARHAPSQQVSIQAISWVLEHSEATSNARCVLIAIANYADRDGCGAWPSIETISREARCSAATVKRALIDLRGIGEVDWQSGAGNEGTRRKSNLYRLPKMMAQIELPFGNNGSFAGDKGSNETRQGLTGELRTVKNQKQPKGAARNSAPPISDAHTGPGAEAFVAMFVDEYRKRGTEPPKSWLGRVGKACRQMLDEETDAAILEKAVRLAAERNRPGSIVYIVADIELERSGKGRAHAR